MPGEYKRLLGASGARGIERCKPLATKSLTKPQGILKSARDNSNTIAKKSTNGTLDICMSEVVSIPEPNCRLGDVASGETLAPEGK